MLHKEPEGSALLRTEPRAKTKVPETIKQPRLYCASEGLATVVRRMVPRHELAKLIKVRSTQRVILAQSVGYPAGAQRVASRLLAPTKCHANYY